MLGASYPYQFRVGAASNFWGWQCHPRFVSGVAVCHPCPYGGAATGRHKALLPLRFGAFMGRRLNFSAGKEYAYVTTVVSSEVGHVTIFQRSGTCVCGGSTSRNFGPKTTSAVMLSQWENGALLFVWILTIKRFVLFQRYNMIPKVQSILLYVSIGFFEKT